MFAPSPSNTLLTTLATTMWSYPPILLTVGVNNVSNNRLLTALGRQNDTCQQRGRQQILCRAAPPGVVVPSGLFSQATVILEEKGAHAVIACHSCLLGNADSVPGDPVFIRTRLIERTGQSQRGHFLRRPLFCVVYSLAPTFAHRSW